MNREFFRPSRQRGAAVIMTAGFMLLGVLCLALVVDTGRLYMEKRSLQRVADTIALELASRQACSSRDASGNPLNLAAFMQQARARGGVPANVQVTANCGTYTAIAAEDRCAASGLPTFSTGAGNDVQAVVTENGVRASLVAGGIFGGTLNIPACAVARRGVPNLAQLTIQSGLATLSSTNSPLLNPLVNGLLGGNLNLGLMNWDNLLNTDLNLLTYLSALVPGMNSLLHTNIQAGDYNGVLNTSISIANLATLTAGVLTQQGVASSTAALNDLQLLSAAVGQTTIKLGDLLGIQAGTPVGTDVALNLLDLVQGGIQLANGQSGVAANVPVNLPGVGGISLKVKIVEKPQMSAIGDPALIAQKPIYVRTAQTRILLDLKLDALNDTVAGILNVLNQLNNTVPVIDALVSVLNANISNIGVTLVNGVGNLLSGILGLVGGILDGVGSLLLPGLPTEKVVCNGDCPAAGTTYASIGSFSVGIGVGAAEARVTGPAPFVCDGSKTLNVGAKSAIASVSVGKFDEGVFFSKDQPVFANPAPIIEIGYRKVRPEQCNATRTCQKLWGACLPSTYSAWTTTCTGAQYEAEAGGWTTSATAAKKTVIAGISLQANANSVGDATEKPLIYTDTPNIGEEPDFQAISATDIIGSLDNTLGNINVRLYNSLAGGSLLGGALNLVSQPLLDGLVTTVQNLIRGVPPAKGLAGILDPVINQLLALLGVNVANAEVGANLTCGADGVRLVR